MKIIYTYIADFPPFKNAEMNFVSDYRCNFNGEKLRIKHSKVLPKGFFSHDDRLCVSAVVGPNGAGKTSLIRFLRSLMYPVQKQEFVLVLEAKGDIIVYYNLNGGRIQVEGEGCKVKSVNNRYENTEFMQDAISTCFNVVYYSPHYSLSVPFRFTNDDFVNLSTTYLLNNTMDGSSSQARCVSSSIFIAEEFYRLVRFYEACKDMSNVVEQVPKGVAFVPDTQTLEFIFQYYSELLNKEKVRIKEIRKGIVVGERELTNNEMQRIETMLSFLGFDFDDAFMCVFQCFVAIIWQRKIFKDKFLNGKEYGCLLLDFCASLIDSDNMDKRTIRSKVINFLKLNKPEQIGKLEYLNEDASSIKEENPLFAFFKILSDLTSHRGGEGEVYLQMPWNKLMKNLEFVKELYGCTTAIGAFVEWRFDPPMSSGQYTLYSFYARLYEYFVNIRDCVAGYDGSDFSHEWAFHMESGWIVILDEVEVTLHPEWQRTIVSNVLHVFKEFFKGFNVHLIFATHSPILLSDVPAGNVVLLDKGRVINGQTKDGEEFKPFGFGANIYDLYRHSFFLKNGAVGLFARKKIDDVVRKICELLEPSKKSKKEPEDKFNYDEANKISNLVADPIVRKYLKSVIPLAKERANA